MHGYRNRMATLSRRKPHNHESMMDSPFPSSPTLAEIKKCNAKRRKRRPFPVPPAPYWSDCVYIRVPSEQVAMFRFLLEAEDNLAYMTVVDRWKAVLRIVFSPHQREKAMACLETIRDCVAFTRISLPDDRET